MNHHQDKATFLERLIFNNRPVVIALCALVTMLLLWQASHIRPSTSFEKMIPLEHPFIQKMLEHRNDLANLGNTVRISVEAKDGDIFSKEYMETLRQIHDEVFYIAGVDRSGLKSLWSPAVRWTEVTEEGFDGGEVIPQTYDGSAESLQELRNNVLKSGQVGRLVANNFKSSIVDVPLLEQYPDPNDQSKLVKLDYRQFSHELEEKVREKYQAQNPNVQIHIVGFAKKVGDLIDGLIMVVAFVGFVGAYVQPVFAADQAFAAGALAACLVTWFTFLPSFLFILAGGPVVESTHGQLKFTAPLTAITAAVVGVIVNLALFFGYHVLWPEGFAGRFDWPSAMIALGAAVALFRYKRGVIQVLLACAVAGLAVHLLR